MSYYARPMGDYKTYGYAGDPGWLSSLWKGIKKVAPAIIGGVIGGPVGAVLGGMGGGATMKPTPPIMAYGTGGIGPPAGAIGGAVTFPGGTRVSLAGQLPVAHAGIGPHAPAGYHLDKATGTRWVRNRRMNIANPKALRRAMRRAQGFEKMAKRVINFNKRVRPARKSS